MNGKNKVEDENTGARHREDELDEGLEESFPASDPPANTQPGTGGPDDKGKNKGKKK